MSDALRTKKIIDNAIAKFKLTDRHYLCSLSEEELIAFVRVSFHLQALPTGYVPLYFHIQSAVQAHYGRVPVPSEPLIPFSNQQVQVALDVRGADLAIYRTVAASLLSIKGDLILYNKCNRVIPVESRVALIEIGDIVLFGIARYERLTKVKLFMRPFLFFPETILQNLFQVSSASQNFSNNTSHT